VPHHHSRGHEDEDVDDEDDDEDDEAGGSTVARIVIVPEKHGRRRHAKRKGEVSLAKHSKHSRKGGEHTEKKDKESVDSADYARYKEIMASGTASAKKTSIEREGASLDSAVVEDVLGHSASSELSSELDAGQGVAEVSLLRSKRSEHGATVGSSSAAEETHEESSGGMSVSGVISVLRSLDAISKSGGTASVNLCTKLPTTGWYEFKQSKRINKSTDANADNWNWQHCASLCATSSDFDCEFWTLELTKAESCFLMNGQGTYHEKGHHASGVRDSNCAPWQASLLKAGDSMEVAAKEDSVSETSAQACMFSDKTGWYDFDKVRRLEHADSIEVGLGQDWSWRQCATLCGAAEVGKSREGLG
jgi:hypothetical protein